MTDRESLRSRFKQTAAQTWRPPAAPTQPGTGGLRLPPRATAPELRRTDLLAVKSRLHEQLLDELGERNLTQAGDGAVTEAVEAFVDRVLAEEDLPLNAAERQRLAAELEEETLGVGPLAPLFADPAVTDILVNGPHQVYVERFGKLEPSDVRFRDAEHVVRVIERIAARLGRRIDASLPLLDARLPDGSRVNATLPPATVDGPTLSIRRFGRRRMRGADLVRLGSLAPEMLGFLEHAVRLRRNILIAGGTGAGKSTLLGVVAEAIPADERVITIEDTAELQLDQAHVVRMETRPPNVEGRGELTARDLVRNALRMRPDRIVVGEVRGAEALDMLQAMNTGHEGSLSTVHANTPRDALRRLETMVLLAGTELPARAIREQVVSALDLLVHVRRFEDGARRVESVAEITGLEGDTPLLQEVFVFERQGRRSGAVEGRYRATGIVPRLVEQARQRGVELPLAWFSERAR